MRTLRPGSVSRAGRRSRRLEGGGPRGDGLGKTGGGARALAVTRSVAATVAAADLEPRNACIARWTGGPRGAAAATARGRRPARRRRGKTGGGVRAQPVASPGAATVAAADVELRNACIALWRCVPRGAAARAARARENRWRPSGAGDSDGPCGDGGARPAVETVASAPPESCLTLRRRIPLHCAARGRGKME